ncbi:gliding motility protein [Flavobacterium franklandianum]|uniref:type IX secretion system periplasmic lipoprotein PorW/SprE n=1 Tax=Flavobacterium franklandianum TaxID=2594430 RepID=UPI00117B39A3|nr:tetratricopeptide repeat protein [Flavobacterium franklandianum]TRX24534.1 gliding motility protein [Flavobacterium franklandianum]
MINCFPLKTKIFKHAFVTLFILFLVACSTKKDTFLARNSHALSTKDNILYNGQIALDKGVVGIKSSNKDNFWTRLPIERMQFKEDDSPNGNSKNPDFEAAEAKATKAIQKHSMYIDGQEKNYQIDEAYLLLGKARYYDQRFFPALEAFNYILYKYPTSSNINPAKIWREKTNMRLGNDAQVLKNIAKLLKEKKLKPQVVADANALLAESFLNLEEKDSAIVKLKIAKNSTKINAEKARYRFILGQLYQELGIKDTALIYYQEVIDMNRKAEREYVIQAYAKRAQLFDFENGDKEAFVKTYNKLVADRENRPFLGTIYYEIGVFYDKNNDQELAKEFYNTSLKSKSTDNYLLASNYRNIGNMHFKNTDYFTAAKYYDSTLVKLDVKTREHIHIKKVRKDLDEVIEFESIAKTNDSILNVVAMSDANRILYYEDYIVKLKKSDEEKRLLAEKQKEIQKNIDINNLSSSDDPATGVQQGGKALSKKSLAPPSMTGSSTGNAANVFYFYNPSTVAFGKIEFKKKFGNRALGGNWRMPANRTDVATDITNDENETPDEEVVVAETPQYTPSFYIEMLPKTQTEIDSIAKERNFTYYQLGVIYKEKFKEYKLASDKLEKLLEQNPEEKLVLPSMYNLYKIYQITDAAKAEEMKNRISSQYPDSRYAQIINNKNPNTVTESETTEAEYNKWYKSYQDEQFVILLEKIDGLIIQYYGDEIVPKYELLKANTIGKLRGLEAYKKAMLFVADNYASSEEGKNAREILTTQIPLLERMNFTISESKNWKILYKVGQQADKATKNIEDKINKFIAGENLTRLTYTFDIYTEKENFITIQGIKSEAYAKNLASILKEDKKFKIIEPAIVISSDNYKVVQIKKNLAEYLTPQKTVVVPAQSAVPNPVVPEPAVVSPETPDKESPKLGWPSPSKASRTRPPSGVPTMEDNDKPSATPKQ